MLVLVLMIASFQTPLAFAEDAHICPAPGPDFGRHIAGMTPMCPLMDGQMFGTMVSRMARGIPCPMPCPMHSQ
jgi:hypothetical protein